MGRSCVVGLVYKHWISFGEPPLLRTAIYDGIGIAVQLCKWYDWSVWNGMGWEICSAILSILMAVATLVRLVEEEERKEALHRETVDRVYCNIGYIAGLWIPAKIPLYINHLIRLPRILFSI
jgi:hypothetical protein